MSTLYSSHLTTLSGNTLPNETLASYDDAFQRLRISNPVTLHHHHYMDGTKIDTNWNSFGSGSETYIEFESAMNISCNSTQRYVRQSKMYIQYQPGNSSHTKMTGVLAGSLISGCISKIGIFDDA